MTVRLLLQDVAEGIRVLQTRDGVDLTDEVHQMDLLDQIEARAEARNNGRPGRA